MESRNAGLLFLVVLVIGVLGFLFSYRPPERKEAELSFVPAFPRAICAGEERKAYVDVSCSGGDARDISILLSSEVVAASSDRKDVIRSGATERMTLTLFAKDVRDGKYPVSISLQFTDDFKTKKTDPKIEYVFVLPSVEFTDIRWIFDIGQPLGKRRIARNDETEVYLRVVNKSKNATVLYSGMSIKAELSMKEVGVTVTPSSVSVDPLGRGGISPSYTFKLKSKNAIVGIYELRLLLYSKDDELVLQLPLEFTVTA